MMKKTLSFDDMQAQSALELPDRELLDFSQIGLVNLFVPINLAINVCPQVNVAVLAVLAEQENLCVAIAEQDLDF